MVARRNDPPGEPGQPNPDERTVRIPRERKGARSRSSRPGARWLAIARKELVFPALAAVLAGIVVLAVEYGPVQDLFAPSAPAGSPRDWDTHGVAEVTVVQSWGSVGALSDGRVYLSLPEHQKCVPEVGDRFGAAARWRNR